MPRCSKLNKYLVTVPKILAFIDHWTGKDRARDQVNPYSTLQSYIGTGLTHLIFLQEATTMSLQQLQAAEFKQLTTIDEIADKLKLEVKPVSSVLRSQ